MLGDVLVELVAVRRLLLFDRRFASGVGGRSSLPPLRFAGL
ncbi:MAG TPA: hypothetical protein VFA62_03125 [Acidimicrobiia bacterium]|nr:hypothetical protein [Acidimicrobiia bacterium]